MRFIQFIKKLFKKKEQELCFECKFHDNNYCRNPEIVGLNINGVPNNYPCVSIRNTIGGPFCQCFERKEV